MSTKPSAHIQSAYTGSHFYLNDNNEVCKDTNMSTTYGRFSKNVEPVTNSVFQRIDSTVLTLFQNEKDGFDLSDEERRFVKGHLSSQENKRDLDAYLRLTNTHSKEDFERLREAVEKEHCDQMSQLSNEIKNLFLNDPSFKQDETDPNVFVRRPTKNAKDSSSKKESSRDFLKNSKSFKLDFSKSKGLFD